MAKEKIEIKEIQATDKGFRVSGTVGSEAPIDFVATTFQWGSKMLMKVDDEFMDRGTRIAVGHAAKKAIRSAGLVLPEAVLKRPRKAKVEAVEAAPTPSEAPVGDVELTSLDAALEGAGVGF